MARWAAALLGALLIGAALTPAAPAAPRPAGELGLVPILMYHRIGHPEGTWTRTPDHLRADLERLYALGFRPVLLSDYLRGWIDLPAGTHPVVLTFDDGTEGQFRYLSGPGGQPRVDPDSAVGILLGFAREHPDFPPRAAFFVNWPHPFGQPRWSAHKLRRLVELGMELGNHTHDHVNLARVDREEGEAQLARAQAAVRAVLPGYALRSLALPFGTRPRDDRYLRAGGRGAGAYNHLGVLLVGAGPAPSPFDPRLDRTRIPRIRADGPNLERWLAYLAAHPERVFTSDGRPDRVTPAGPEAAARGARAAGGACCGPR